MQIASFQLVVNDLVESRTSPSSESASRIPDLVRSEPKPSLANPSATALFDLYENVVKHRPGTRDAEIFEKIREWTFSDFTLPAHEFAGVAKAELDSWQKRNRINLSVGHIRPQPIDLERGYAWGQIRMIAAVNRLHGTVGPPSAEEIRRAWLKQDG